MDPTLQPPYNDAEIGWWPGYGDPINVATVPDFSGNDRNLALTIGSGTIADRWVIDGGRYALRHEVADFYRYSPSSFSHNGDWTVSLWFQVFSGTGAQQAIIDVRGVSGALFRIGVDATGSGTGRAFLFTMPGLHTHTSTSNLLGDGLWHHILATRSGANYSFILDGIADNDIELTSQSLVDATSVGFGNLGTSSAASVDGMLDDLAVWPRVLSGPEKAFLYSNGRGAAYFKLLSGDYTGSTTSTAALQVSRLLSGQYSGSTVASSSLLVERLLSAQYSGVTGAHATLLVERLLAGSYEGALTATAKLKIPRAVLEGWKLRPRSKVIHLMKRS